MANDNTALARVQQTTPAPFEPVDLDQAFTLAENLSHASLLPTHLRNKPADVFLTLLLGRDLGLTATQAIIGIHVIEGKPSVSAGLAVALVKRSPLCVYFRLLEEDDNHATYETQRKGYPAPSRMSYTTADAQRAGLLGKKNWRENPAAMLRARCSMALARDVYQDVVANIYDPDELDAAVERAAEVVTAPPKPAPRPPVEAPKPKRTAGCGMCGRAPVDHPSDERHGQIRYQIDAECRLRTPEQAAVAAQVQGKPVEEKLAEGAAPTADRPVEQGFGDLVDRLAFRLEAAMDLAETKPQLDAIASSVKTGVADGQITEDERAHALGVYRKNVKRIDAEPKA